MPLANIAIQPTRQTQRGFDFSHYADHVAIVQAINALGHSLPVYAIHPGPLKNDTWKRLHQAFHNDMNLVLKTNGTDLTGIIDSQWYSRNYFEHAAAHQQLGI